MHVQQIKRVGQNRLEYSYTIEGEWRRFFESQNPMWVEYSQPVDTVPDSIAVLPLIGNVIVLASLMDADIYVNEIDQDFYECIEEFIAGFDSIMPDHVHFKHQGIVHAKKLVKSPQQAQQQENLLFFSGGVDATFSLISHLQEKPSLVTVWGADISCDNESGWTQAIKFNQETADRYGLTLLTIRSNFRKSLNNDHLEDYSMNLVQDWWWSAFHHSVAMMCLAAPMAEGKLVYFGSSYSSKDRKEWGEYVIASDPLIDNHVRFCGGRVIHDGYDYSRFDKIQQICAFYADQEKKPFLRVCYLSNTGKTCGICQKCSYAIMAILLSGGDPHDYGFQYHPEDIPKYFAAGLQELARAEKCACMSEYTDVQTAYRNAYSADQVTPPVLRAFYETDLETLVDFLHVPNNEIIEKEKAVSKMQEQLYQQIGQLQWRLDNDIRTLQEENQALSEQLHALETSKFWRITGPLRYVIEQLRQIKARVTGTVKK